MERVRRSFKGGWHDNTVASLLLIRVLLFAATLHLRADSLLIDGSETNQIIDGFGVNAAYYAWTNNDLKPVIDGLVDEAGMTLFRVVFNNGWEAINDNSDSTQMDWAYYNSIYSSPECEKLWGFLGYLNEKGLTNEIMLNFQGPGPDWMGGYFLTPGFEDEWAESVASLVIYARNTRHLQFGLLAPNNEPDSNEGIHVTDARQYVTSLHALAANLDANGLSDIRFVGPDLSSPGILFIPEMMSDPLVASKIAHFGLHSYSPNGDGSHGITDYLTTAGYANRSLWMTEYAVWCDVCEHGSQGTNDWDYFLSTAAYLFGHLYDNASAGLVWEGYDSFYPHHEGWSFWGLFAVDDTDAVPKTYTRRQSFYTLAQVAKFVRPGARRIGADTSLDALAFYHDGLGQLTVVGINHSQQSIDIDGTLENLPAINSLDLYYTTAATNLFHAGSVAVVNDSFSLTVPASCIYTLTGFAPGRPPAPELRITARPGVIALSWDATASGFALESTVDMSDSMSWSVVTNVPVQNAPEATVEVSPVDQQRFFRLRWSP